jgi:hypothetical protein
MVMSEEVPARCDFGAFCQGTSKGTLPQFEGRLQLGRLGLPYTWNSAEFFDSALRKPSHTTEPIQDIHPDLHG